MLTQTDVARFKEAAGGSDVLAAALMICAAITQAAERVAPRPPEQGVDLGEVVLALQAIAGTIAGLAPPAPGKPS